MEISRECGSVGLRGASCRPAAIHAGQTIHGAYFGLPHKSADRPALKAWVSAQVLNHGTSLGRAFMLVSPNDDREMVAAALRRGQFCGLKVYHCYANRPDTMQSDVREFAPEWMREILHEVRGVLMLHIVRDSAMDDGANQQSLRRLCRAYPQARVHWPTSRAVSTTGTRAAACRPSPTSTTWPWTLPPCARRGLPGGAGNPGAPARAVGFGFCRQ